MSSNKKEITKLDKEKTVCMFIQMLNSVRMYHWKTLSYAQHIATDQLYKDLDSKVDEFIETMLGKKNDRIPNFEVKISLINTDSKEKFKKELFKYRDFLINMNNSLESKKDADLINIKDEILGHVNQFLYLFGFNK